MPDQPVPEIPSEFVDYTRRLIAYPLPETEPDKFTPEHLFESLIRTLKEFGAAEKLLIFKIDKLPVLVAYLADPKHNVSAVIAELRARFPGLRLEPDTRVAALQLAPNDPLYGQQWALAKVNAEPAWARVAAIQGTAHRPPVKVAIIDSGIQKNHQDFDPTMISGKRVIPPVSNTNFGDDSGHGTMLAGTIAAIADNNFGIAGEARNVEIIALQFSDARAPGTSLAAVVSILEAIDRGAKIINASWHVLDDTGLLEPAIRFAGVKGILFVAAAGNYGSDNTRVPVLPATYPNLDNMIVVMASDEHDKKCWFSNYGTNVDVAAPGVRILSTGLYYSTPAYRSYNGTSAAAAHVTAAAALLLTIDDWSPLELRDHLVASAEPVHDLEGVCFAEGRLDLSRAVVGPFSVERPKGGRLHRGALYNVVWHSHYAAAVVTSVEISFLDNTGAVLSKDLNCPNIGKHKMKVPNHATPHATIRVKCEQKNLYADSHNFQIV
jgi:thermitase